MLRTIILFIAGSCFLFSGTAQNKYAVNLIPLPLLSHANVVKRMEEIKVTIKNEGTATISNKYALTVFNAGGDEAADFVEFYDQLISIENIEGTLYDAAGKKIKSLKKNDIEDVSGTSSSSLADDNRLKKHSFNCRNYPYTVEYETVVSYRGIFYLPKWIPVSDEKFAVEKSKLIVQCPIDYKLRYKTFNYSKDPIISTINQSNLYEWNVENIVPVLIEDYQPQWHEVTPAVYLAPTNFEMQQYKGNMGDWISFGKFGYTLNNGRDILPENIKQRVHSLSDELKSNREKIKILYEYMQENTHYISVQLGIGGWQTFDANYVATKGYGDCKALSNYMYSLLKEAGIKSYYTWIKAGENNNSFLEDFPSNQFNHCIVCVPQGKDTIWLECTSQTLPMGYLSGFTSNRNALLIDETGGKLVHTPMYKKSENTQIRKITATVNKEGQLKANIVTAYKAEQQDRLELQLSAYSKEKIGERLQTKLNLPSYTIDKFDYTIEKAALPVITETMALSANNYCTISGKRIFINPNILNVSATKIKDAASRKFDIKLPYSFIDIDSVEINIPGGYIPESIPENAMIQSKFGSYKTKYILSAGKIIYIRQREQNGGRFPASDAVEMAKYFLSVSIADKSKLVYVMDPDIKL